MRLRLEWDAEWTQQKMDIATQVLRRELAFLRGVSNVSVVAPATPDQKEPSGPKRLKLRCTRLFFNNPEKPCNAEWEAVSFTNCPKCGQRKWVQKMEESSAA